MFCEECGAKLEDGVRFCENCGTPIPLDSVVQDGKKEVSSGMERGVIITRLASLAAQLGCSSQELFNKVSEYVQYRKSCGVDYSFIDLESVGGSVDSVIYALKAKNNEMPLTYVFILGNEDIIPVAEFKNQCSCSNSDPTVTTDLPYMTLCNDSPWESLPVRMEDFLCVGRLPSYRGESFYKFSSYFDNAMKAQGAFGRIETYGLSADVWKKESDFEYKNISLKPTDSSPVVTVENVALQFDSNANVLFFNLHGSNQTKFWYGQQGESYPEAFSPDKLLKLNVPYFIGVEACYGANYIGNLSEDDSILLSAMQTGCLAFLGSSKIAYGTPAPKGSCADFMIGEYLKEICAGATAGKSHIAGIRRLFEESSDFSDTEIKTLAEFSLYGDPSISTGRRSDGCSLKTQFSSSLITSSRKGVNGLHISMPDIRSFVEMSLAEVDSKIASIINEHVYSTHKELCGITPKTFKFSNKDLWQSVYEKQIGVIQKIVKVYYDKKGTIKKELESK